MREPLNRLSAAKLAQMIAAGDVTSEVVTRSFIDAIHERNASIEAFAWFEADRALETARELDRMIANDRRRGSLHGVPVAVKDNIDTADMPTGYGSAIFATHKPNVDAACVGLLKDAGGFVLGKTVTAELANFTPGPTRNPHNPAHTPGGSSSGSAAAVAAHFAPLALGTQTAGSVIRPAAFCGVYAYKPSPRLVPRCGVKPNSDTMDEVGAFARCVEDLALAGAVLALKPAWKDVPAQYLESGAVPTIGWTATPHANAASASMLATLESSAQRLVQRGARHTEITWPRVFDGLFDAQKTVQLYETARALAAEYTYRRDLLSARLVDLIDQGRAIDTRAYIEALQLGRACTAAIDSLFGAADVVLCPSAPGEAPRGLGSTGDPIFNRPWHLIGCPALNIPCGHGESGLPLGLQLIARPGDDAKLLAAGAWIEAKLKD